MSESNQQEAQGPEENQDGSPEAGSPTATPSKKTWGQEVRDHFPEANNQDVDFILWELTCFPFDTKSTIKQLKELAAKVRPAEAGWESRLGEEAERAWDQIDTDMHSDSVAKPAASAEQSPSEVSQ